MSNSRLDDYRVLLCLFTEKGRSASERRLFVKVAGARSYQHVPRFRAALSRLIERARVQETGRRGTMYARRPRARASEEVERRLLASFQGDHGLQTLQTLGNDTGVNGSELEAAVAALVAAGRVEELPVRTLELTGAGVSHLLSSIPADVQVYGGWVAQLLEAARQQAAPPVPAPVPVKVAVPADNGHDGPFDYGRFRDQVVAYFKRHELGSGGLVPIYKVRRALNVPKQQFDEALTQMQREQWIHLVKLNDARGVSRDKLDDSLYHRVRGLLYFISEGRRM